MPETSTVHRYVSYLAPSFTEFLVFLITPTILTIYFTFLQYTNLFLTYTTTERAISQHDVFATLYLTGTIQQWFQRFTDFAFWGVIASIIILLAWGVSAAQASFSNHMAIEQFENFKVSKESWHGHFLIVMTVKVLLIFVIIYAMASILVTAVPMLSDTISMSVQSPTVVNVAKVFGAGFLLVALQAIMIIAVRMFKHANVE